MMSISQVQEILNKRLKYSEETDWRLNNGLWQIYGNHGYTEDYKIVRKSWHEIRANNTAGWPYKENSADTSSNKMIVTLLNSKKSLPQKLVGKIVSAKDYRQESIAAKIPDNARVTNVKELIDGTLLITLDKDLKEQAAIVTNQIINIRFISYDADENPGFTASDSLLTGNGYKGTAVSDDMANVLSLTLDPPSFIKGRTYVPAHNISGFIFAF